MGSSSLAEPIWYPRAPKLSASCTKSGLPNDTADWRVYGAVFNPGQKPALTSLDQANPVAPASAEAPGDLMGSYFNPDGTLDVVWTRDVLRLDDVATLERDIYFARSK